MCQVGTLQAVLIDVTVNVEHLAAGLKGASVGVEVHVSDALLYSHSRHDAGLGEGVDGVHELSVVRRQSVKRRQTFEVRPGRIQSCVTQTSMEKSL